MKKIKMKNIEEDKIIFENAFSEFVKYCKQRNFRKDTIEHYERAYINILKFIPYDFNVKELDVQIYNNYILYLKEKNIKESTVNIYLKDFKRIINFFIDQGYTKKFTIQLPKTDINNIEFYTDEELKILLRRPNMKNVKFNQFRDWVIVNTFLSTAIRLSSLTNIKMKDLDFESNFINITHTKNRKALIIPMNSTLVKIIKEYIKHRGGNDEDYLFCTQWGGKMSRACIGSSLRKYNQDRGIEKTGIHLYRHTFSRKWIINGNSVVTLQKILGHYSLDMTQKYITLLTSDLKKEMNEYNILDEFNNTRITIKK